MTYIDYDYYSQTYGGSSVSVEEFKLYEIKSRMQVDRYTFNRVKNAMEKVPNFSVPDEIKNAQCAVMDYIKKVDAEGGAVVVSETVSKHSVTYSKKSFEDEMKEIIKNFLHGTSWTYLGGGAGIVT